jgi:hypothetical protein
MGSNHRAAGFATVKQFVTALARSEGAHLQAFVNFIRSSPPMLAALRNKDWAGFAKRYSGPAYYVKGYDQSLEKAYNGFVKERADKKSGLR